MYDIPECCLYKYSLNMFPFFSIPFHISNNLLPVIISHIPKTLCSLVYGGTTVMTHLTYCTWYVYITFFFIVESMLTYVYRLFYNNNAWVQFI